MLSNLQKQCIDLLLVSKALQFGNFILKNGEKSPFFIDVGSVAHGQSLLNLGGILAETLYKNFPHVDILFGPAYKGIVLATATAIEYQKRFGRSLGILYDRKEPKKHGEGGLFVGETPTKEHRIVIIDDVMTNGGTKLTSIQALQTEYDTHVEGILVVVDRTRKNFNEEELKLPPFISVVSVLDMVNYLEQVQDKRCNDMKIFWQGEPKL